MALGQKHNYPILISLQPTLNWLLLTMLCFSFSGMLHPALSDVVVSEEWGLHGAKVNAGDLQYPLVNSAPVSTVTL